jgi:type I restriction enzyme M protein
MLCVTNMLLHGIEDPSFVRHDNTLARPYISYSQSDRVDIVLTNPPFGGREEDGIESNFPRHFQTRETADLFLALIIRLLKTGGRAAVVLPDGSLFGEGVKTRLKEHLLEECNLHTIVRLPNTYEAPGCQETDFPYERISCFFPLGWSRRNRHPVTCPGLISVCGHRPHVSAPNTY